MDQPFDQEAEAKRYAELLRPIFTYQNDYGLEYVHAILRSVSAGVHDAGWDSFEESFELIQDFLALTRIDLTEDRFPNPKKTRWRLALVIYAHLTEMDAPYHMLANLLRVRLNEPYITAPFRDLWRQIGKKNKPPSILDRRRPPSPTKKIGRIQELATKAQCPDVAKVFDDFYSAALRNAIDHSDYVLHREEIRLPSSLTPVIPFDQLERIIGRAFAFYTAFFSLHRDSRASFTRFKGQCLPYDVVYKGLVEFLIDDRALLNGFVIHWPNLSESIFERSAQGGCRGQNVTIESDDAVNFNVGFHPEPHDPFSPVLEPGQAPRYTPPRGLTTPPVWPQDR